MLWRHVHCVEEIKCDSRLDNFRLRIVNTAFIFLQRLFNETIRVAESVDMLEIENKNLICSSGTVVGNIELKAHLLMVRRQWDWDIVDMIWENDKIVMYYMLCYNDFTQYTPLLTSQTKESYKTTSLKVKNLSNLIVSIKGYNQTVNVNLITTIFL